MSIHDLSVELLQLILLQCRPSDLASFQPTCRSIHHLAQPLLYTDINFKSCFTSPNLPSPQLLTRTLLYCPSLGLQIKSLRLRGPQHWHSHFNISDQDLALLARRGSKLGHGAYLTWLEALISNSREAFLVILLSYLPSLITLAFEDDPNVHFNIHHSPLGSWLPPHSSTHTKSASLFSHALTKLPALKNIELNVQNEGTPLSHHSSILHTMQLLPALASIICSMKYLPSTNSSTYFPLPILAPIVSSSNLTSLTLKDCVLSERSAVLVTTRFPNLTTLNINFTRRSLTASERLAGRVPPDSHLWLDCALLGQYLTSGPNLEKLQHLSLSLSFPLAPSSNPPQPIGGAYECGRSMDNTDPICFFGIKGSLDSLQALTSLRTLSVPTPVLLGWYPDRALPLNSLLPEGLQDLRLRNDLSDWGLYKWDAKSVDSLMLIHALK